MDFSLGRQPATLAGMSRELPEHYHEIVSVQRGVLSRAQALDSGVAAATIASRLRAGRWQRLHRGVYATFTGEPGRDAEFWAALRRAGPDAVLSYDTAAELSQLTTRRSALIHVTVPRPQHVSPVRGLVIHRSGRIEAARHPGLLPPRTRVEETALDLAGAAASLDDAFGWLTRACGARLTTPERLRAAMNDRARMRWRTDLATALDDITQGAHSVLELRYVRRVERPHRLPEAERQARVVRGRHTEYRDALYRAFGVAVETDGQFAHPPEEHWRDRHRDNASVAEGIVTLRYSWTDVTQRPCQVAAEIATVLQRHGWRGTPRPCSPICPITRV
jgi:predicted transcriptional regulator of viral defense system